VCKDFKALKDPQDPKVIQGLLEILDPRELQVVLVLQATLVLKGLLDLQVVLALRAILVHKGLLE
jgi:hypothetical protein